MYRWKVLLCALLLVISFTAILPFAQAENDNILDGRWLCSNIAGNVTEDTPAELKDDFGLYVNKPWLLQAEFTAGVPTVSNQSEIQIAVMDRLIALMKDESFTGHDAELVHKLYALTSDWDYRNAQGLSPALPYMQAIAAIDSLDALMKYLCSGDRLTDNEFFSCRDQFLCKIVVIGNQTGCDMTKCHNASAGKCCQVQNYFRIICIYSIRDRITKNHSSFGIGVRYFNI